MTTENNTGTETEEATVTEIHTDAEIQPDTGSTAEMISRYFSERFSLNPATRAGYFLYRLTRPEHEEQSASRMSRRGPDIIIANARRLRRTVEAYDPKEVNDIVTAKDLTALSEARGLTGNEIEDYTIAVTILYLLNLGVEDPGGLGDKMTEALERHNRSSSLFQIRANAQKEMPNFFLSLQAAA